MSYPIIHNDCVLIPPKVGSLSAYTVIWPRCCNCGALASKRLLRYVYVMLDFFCSLLTDTMTAHRVVKKTQKVRDAEALKVEREARTTAKKVKHLVEWPRNAASITQAQKQTRTSFKIIPTPKARHPSVRLEAKSQWHVISNSILILFQKRHVVKEEIDDDVSSAKQDDVFVMNVVQASLIDDLVEDEEDLDNFDLKESPDSLDKYDNNNCFAVISNSTWFSSSRLQFG